MKLTNIQHNSDSNSVGAPPPSLQACVALSYFATAKGAKCNWWYNPNTQVYRAQGSAQGCARPVHVYQWLYVGLMPVETELDGSLLIKDDTSFTSLV